MMYVHLSVLIGHWRWGIGRLQFRYHGWRRARQRECETKGRTTTRTIFSPDMSTVGLNDTTANRQPQSGTTGLSGPLGAIKLFKHALLLTRRQSWSLVSHFDGHSTVRGPSRKRQRTAWGGVFDGVIEHIDQHLLDQHAIQGHQRQVRGQVRGERAIAQRRVQARQGGPHHL